MQKQSFPNPVLTNLAKINEKRTQFMRQKFGGSSQQINNSREEFIPYKKFNPTESSDGFENSIKRMNPAPIQYMNQNNSLEKISEKESNDSLFEAIIENKINPISLLNEVSSKVRKDINFQISDCSFDKIPLFESKCIFDGMEIGTGKGSSKNIAKTESATEGVLYILSQEHLVKERAHIVLKIREVSSHSSSYVVPYLSSQISKPISINEKHDFVVSEEITYLNGSPLYEFELLSNGHGKWNLSAAEGRNLSYRFYLKVLANGGFKAEVNLDNLFATGSGRKKTEAQKEAAEKIIQKIRSDTDLIKKYYPKKFQAQILKAKTEKSDVSFLKNFASCKNINLYEI